ncbi:SRPBCC family protein [Phenylobacterium sp.]|uniref:SRPBCC family protein n=1 Tax=Phenylobacterium sp. TaxID=1871053 RepID=UPI0011FB4A26|nr:SRPBCC family protein [Phenylobacterium sp.]THD57715.1 MAG: ATPase [Phenylobacterium sp.]
MKRLAILALFAACAAGAARAEITDRSAAGFEVTERISVTAPPGKVWDRLMRIDRWWSPEHTWSHDAKNLYFDPSGCFCERLKDGAVRHMTIVYTDGATQLRMFGALGPLQTTGASGHLAVTLKPAGAGTDVVMTYDVGGYARGGLSEIYASPVDRVLGEQLARLKKSVETGKPE